MKNRKMLSLLLAGAMTAALLAYEKGKTAGITQTFAPHAGELKAACGSLAVFGLLYLTIYSCFQIAFHCDSSVCKKQLCDLV